MAANQGQRAGAESFTAPTEVNHRRYEALRAYYVEGLSLAQAAERFGYTRWAMVNLVRQHKAGGLALFAPARKPGPKSAPRKDRVRGRVVELRRRGRSVYEIAAALAAEGTPLNRTSVGEILAEEGFGRLLRGPEPAASTSPATTGRDTRLPAARVLDFTTLPARFEPNISVGQCRELGAETLECVGANAVRAVDLSVRGPAQTRVAPWGRGCGLTGGSRAPRR